MSKQCIRAPIRLPSGTGVNVLELAKYVGRLPTRDELMDKLRSRLKMIEKTENPVIVFIVAEWGEGKTSIFEVFLRGEWERSGKEPRKAFLIPADTVFRYISDIVEGKYLVDTKSSSYILFSAILAALAETERLPLPDIKNYSDARKYVPEALKTLYDYLGDNNYKLMLFIDEFEDIIHYYRAGIGEKASREREIAKTVLQGIVHIANNEVEEISIRGDRRGEYAGKIHFMIAVTPYAWDTIKKDEMFASIVGRLREGGRISEIRIPPLNVLERYQFIKGVLSYAYDSMDKEKILSQVFDPASLVNVFAHTSFGNPAIIQSMISQVIGSAMAEGEKICGSPNEMVRINIENILKYIKMVGITISTTSMPLLNKSIYEDMQDIWINFAETSLPEIDRDKARTILDYLLSSIIVNPEIIEEVVERKYSAQTIIRELNLLGSPGSLYHTKYRVEKIAYPVYRVKIDPDEILKTISKVKDEILAHYPSLRGRWFSEEEILVDIISNFILADRDGKIYFYFNDDLEELSRILYDSTDVFLSKNEAEAFANALLEKLYSIDIASKIDKSKTYYMLSPRILKIIYVSPELLYLNFITENAKRFEIWRKTLNTKEWNPQDIFISVAGIILLSGIEINNVLQVDDRSFLVLAHIAETSKIEYDLNILVYITPSSLLYSDTQIIERIIESLDEEDLHPHVVLIIHYMDSERRAEQYLKEIERKTFSKTVKIRIDTFLSMIRLLAIGKIIEEVSIKSDIKGRVYLIGKLLGKTELARNISREAAGLKIYEEYEEKARKIIDYNRLRQLLLEYTDAWNLKRRIVDALEREPKTMIRDIVRKVYDPEGEITASIKEVFNSMRYVLSYNDYAGTIKEIYDNVEKNILPAIKYGSKPKIPILSPDIESPKELAKYVKLHIANKFVDLAGPPQEEVDKISRDMLLNRKILIDTLNPIEETMVKILDKLSREGKSKEEMGKKLYNYLVKGYVEPETFEQYLRLLYYRGIIELGEKKRGRKSYIIIEEYRDINVLPKDEINKLYQKIRDYADQNGYRIERLGYIVQSKEKGYRVLVVREFIDYLLNLLTAVSSRYYVNIRTSLRTYTTVKDLYIHFRENWEKYLEEADKIINELRKRLNDRKDEIEQLRNEVQSIVGTKVFRNPILLDIKELKELEEAIRFISEELERRYSREELEEIIKSMWEEYGKKNPKDFPFFFRGLGEIFRFNYKLWKIIDKLEKDRIIVFTPSERTIKISERIEEVIRILNEIKKEIEGVYNAVSEMSVKLKSVKGMVTSIDVLKPLAAKIDPENLVKISQRETGKKYLTLDELRSKINEWRRTISPKTIMSKMDRIVSVIGEIARNYGNLSQGLSRARLVLNECAEYDEFVGKIPRIEELKEKCLNINNKLAKINTEIEELKKKLAGINIMSINDLYEVLSENGFVLKKIRDLYSELENVLSDYDYTKREIIHGLGESLRGSLEALERIINTINEHYRENLAGFGLKYESQLNRITDSIAKVKDRISEIMERGAIGEIVELIEEVKKYRDMVHEIIKNTGILSEKELNVYEAYWRHKAMVGGDLVFDDAAKRISIDTGIDIDEVKEIMARLIIKGLLVAKV